MDLPRRLRAGASALLNRARSKSQVEALPEAECRARLALMYGVQDPWKMASEKEQFRFAETNLILAKELIAPSSQVESILEIGCGEGHQSQHLALLCHRLTGLDVVATAIERARLRVPAAELIADDVYAYPWGRKAQRFDIVTACEVLYYLDDISKMLATMSALGRACLVTYVIPSARVARATRSMPILGRRAFAHADVAWEAVWWRCPEV
jgi:predicted TPR repeat methyltransferase